MVTSRILGLIVVLLISVILISGASCSAGFGKGIYLGQHPPGVTAELPANPVR